MERRRTPRRGIRRAEGILHPGNPSWLHLFAEDVEEARRHKLLVKPERTEISPWPGENTLRDIHLQVEHRARSGQNEPPLIAIQVLFSPGIRLNQFNCTFSNATVQQRINRGRELKSPTSEDRCAMASTANRSQKSRPRARGRALT